MSVFKKFADNAERQLKTMNTQLPPKEYENLLLLGSILHLEKMLDEMKKRAEKAELVEYAPVVHGRWEWDTSGLYPKPLCNRCGEEPWRRSNHQSDLPNYCPNCGARMDGTEENG